MERRKFMNVVYCTFFALCLPNQMTFRKGIENKP